MRRRRPSRIKVIRHLVRQFRELPADRRRLHLEAVLELYRARLLVMFVPARQYLSKPAGEACPTDAMKPPSAAMVAEVSRAVTVMARYLPGRLVCLPQAIAARRMLWRRGLASSLHLGVRRSTTRESIEAHAWLMCGDQFVTGEEGAGRHTPLAVFHGDSRQIR